MKRLNCTNLLVALVGSTALVACAPETSTSPNIVAAEYSRASAVTGSYVLSFVDRFRQPITTLVVRTDELILKAHVDDGAGNAAQKGSVSFQYCGYKGPAGDITRPDEAPSSECASGAATWKQLWSLNVDAAGNAYLDFGLVQIPRTVGFRFKYSSQGSNIASGMSVPQDFTWTAPTL